MNPGRFKNQNFHNRMKPMSLRLSYHDDSGHIIFFLKRTSYAKVIVFWPNSQTDKKSTGQSQHSKWMLTSAVRKVTSTWQHDDINITRKWHMSLRFNIFGLGCHCMDLTRGTIWMTPRTLYITWPYDRLTRGSMDERWVVRMLTWLFSTDMTWHDTWQVKGLYERWCGS
jgi:hypothetical protein